jgi:hypothetical protein
VLTKDGYRVKQAEASKYQLPASSPLATGESRANP